MSLLTAETDRSWMHMIEVGSTMTTEAGDVKYMPHFYGWSASPAHIIPRKLLGIEPLEAGFGKISIKPQPGNLTFAKVKLPTIRGNVLVAFDREEGKYFNLNISIHGNTVDRVSLPVISETYTIVMDGNVIDTERKGKYCIIENVNPGKHTLSIIATQ